MIAAIMYAAIGFLVASLGTLVIIPLVHNRGVRLASKRLETKLPQSMTEIHAGKDQLRAEFAVSTRRLEAKIEELKEKSAKYLVKLSTKDSVIEKLEAERDARQVENTALEVQIEALAVRSNEVLEQLNKKSESYLIELGNKGIVIDKLETERDALQAKILSLKFQVDTLTAAGKEIRAEGGMDAEIPSHRRNAEPTMVPVDSVYGLTPSAHDRGGVAVSFMPNVWPIAELFRVPKEPTPANDQSGRGDTILPMARDPISAEAAVDAPKGDSQAPPSSDQQPQNNVGPIVAAVSTAVESVDAPADASQPLPPNDQRREAGIASLVPVQEMTDEPVKPPTDGAFGPLPDNQQLKNETDPVVAAVSTAAEPVDAPADASQPLPPNDQWREDSIASLVTDEEPTAEPVKPPTDGALGPSPNEVGPIVAAVSTTVESVDAPADASQPLPPNEQRREDSIVSLVPVQELTAETVKPPTDGAYAPSTDGQPLQNDAEPATLVDMPAAGPADAPADASQPLPPNDQQREGRIASLVPEPGPSSKPGKPPTDDARGPSQSDQQYRSDAVARLLKRLKPDESEPGNLRRAFDARRGPPDERIGGAGETVAFSDGTNPVVPPIRLSAQDGFAGNKRLTRRSGLARIAAAVPIVAGASLAWHYYGEEATETIKTRISSLDWSSSAWTTKLSQYVEAGWDEIQSFRARQMAAHDAGSQSRPQTAPPPAAAATSPEPTQRELEAVARDLADLRQGVEQLTATQEQIAKNIATRQVAEPSIRHTISVSREQSRVHLSPSPETRPKTIAGWTLLEVTGGAVVLKGPNGVWRARAGDLVPGVGTVDSVVRWGNRWLVATSAGLISTP